VHGLASIVDDDRRDTVTRAMAALAIGELRCEGAGRHRRRGIPEAVSASLESATDEDSPAALRQAAVRALGRAGAAGSVPRLRELRDLDPDPVVRFLAAQALTRITGEDHFDTTFRDDMVARYLEDAAGYRIVEGTP